MDGHSPSFSKRLREEANASAASRDVRSWEKRPGFFPGPPIHVCRSISLSFQPFCSPLLPVLGSLGPRRHCQLCPGARSHPVEPAHPQPCDLPRGHTPRWRQTGPGLETLLGFKSPKADMNSSFCPPSLPSPVPLRTHRAAGSTTNPGPRPLLTLGDPPSLPQRPSSPTLCGRVLPAAGTRHPVLQDTPRPPTPPRRC